MKDKQNLPLLFKYWKVRVYVGCIMILSAFSGLIFSEIKKDASWNYWRILCVLFAVCSVGLNTFIRKMEKVSFLGNLWHEIFHWLGLIVCLGILSIMVNVGVLDKFQSSIAILMLLALTSYIAGIYTDITLAFVGGSIAVIALGLTVVSAYLYPVLVPLIFLLGFSLWLYLRKKHIHNDKN